MNICRCEHLSPYQLCHWPPSLRYSCSYWLLLLLFLPPLLFHPILLPLASLASLGASIRRGRWGCLGYEVTLYAPKHRLWHGRGMALLQPAPRGVGPSQGLRARSSEYEECI